MKKYLLLFLLAFLSLQVASAQTKDKEKMMEEIQQFKIDFLTKEMQLTDKQKAEFISIYKDYDNQRRRAGEEAWKLERKLKKDPNASDADYKRLAELQQKSRAKDNEIVKKFDSRLESFLSAKQIFLMHQGEEKFLEKMKEMRKKKHDGKKRPDGPNSKSSQKPTKDRKDSPDCCDDHSCPADR